MHRGGRKSFDFKKHDFDHLMVKVGRLVDQRQDNMIGPEVFPPWWHRHHHHHHHHQLAIKAQIKTTVMLTKILTSLRSLMSVTLPP